MIFRTGQATCSQIFDSNHTFLIDCITNAIRFAHHYVRCHHDTSTGVCHKTEVINSTTDNTESLGAGADYPKEEMCINNLEINDTE